MIRTNAVAHNVIIVHNVIIPHSLTDLFLGKLVGLHLLKKGQPIGHQLLFSLYVTDGCQELYPVSLGVKVGRLGGEGGGEEG